MSGFHDLDELHAHYPNGADILIQLRKKLEGARDASDEDLFVITYVKQHGPCCPEAHVRIKSDYAEFLASGEVPYYVGRQLIG